MKRNKTYTVEFKKQAIELSDSMGSAKKAAQQLGVSSASISNWKRRLSKTTGGLPGEDMQAELVTLRRENAELKKVNYILKGAAAFFSQDHLK